MCLVQPATGSGHTGPCQPGCGCSAQSWPPAPEGCGCDHAPCEHSPAKSSKEQRHDELIALLTRIATALEWANFYANQPPPYVPSAPYIDPNTYPSAPYPNLPYITYQNTCYAPVGSSVSVG